MVFVCQQVNKHSNEYVSGSVFECVEWINHSNKIINTHFLPVGSDNK